MLASGHLSSVSSAWPSVCAHVSLVSLHTGHLSDSIGLLQLPQLTYSTGCASRNSLHKGSDFHANFGGNTVPHKTGSQWSEWREEAENGAMVLFGVYRCCVTFLVWDENIDSSQMGLQQHAWGSLVGARLSQRQVCHWRAQPSVSGLTKLHPWSSLLNFQETSHVSCSLAIAR